MHTLPELPSFLLNAETMIFSSAFLPLLSTVLAVITATRNSKYSTYYAHFFLRKKLFGQFNLLLLVPHSMPGVFLRFHSPAVSIRFPFVAASASHLHCEVCLSRQKLLLHRFHTALSNHTQAAILH